MANETIRRRRKPNNRKTSKRYEGVRFKEAPIEQDFPPGASPGTDLVTCKECSGLKAKGTRCKCGAF